MDEVTERAKAELKESLEREDNEAAEHVNKDGRSLPSYVHKVNLLERQTFLKESALVNPVHIRLFNAICDFVALPGNNTPIVNLRQFAEYAGKNKAITEFGSVSHNEPLIKKIEESLGANGIGVLEIVEYNEEGEPTCVLLSERDTEQIALFKRIDKYLVANLSEVKGKKGKLKTEEELLKEFKLYESAVKRLLVQVSIEELSQKKIKELAQNKSSLVVINLDHQVGKVVFSAPRLESTILFFVMIVYEYYQDLPNDNLRHLIKERLSRQKLSEQHITAVFKRARLQDNYFLFFSQLFFTVMNNLQNKFLQQNVVNSEVFNQLVASRILSTLSFNQRELMREQQHKDEMKVRKLRAVLEALVVRGIKKGGETIYYPLTMGDLFSVNFKSVITKDGKQEEVNQKIKDSFKAKDIEAYFNSLNNVGHSIKEVISFSVGGENFYVHRTRILQSFWAMITIEAAKVRSKVVRLWALDINKMMKHIDEKKLESIIEHEMVSTFFRSYLERVYSLLVSASPVSGEKFDSDYMLTRFFFTERERARYPKEAANLIYQESHFKKKKVFLKSFFNSVMNKDYGLKEYKDLFKLNVRSLKEETLAVANVGVVTRLVISVIDLLRDLHVDVLADLIMGFFDFLSKLGNLFSFKKAADNKEPEVVSGSGFGFGSGFGKEEEAPRAKREFIGEEPNKKTKEEILNKNPELKNINKIQKEIDALENNWNIKLGDARAELKEKMDDRIDAFVYRCDPQLFIDRNMDAVLDKFLMMNKKLIEEITDKNSLKKYLYYKAALLRTEPS